MPRSWPSWFACVAPVCDRDGRQFEEANVIFLPCCHILCSEHCLNSLRVACVLANEPDRILCPRCNEGFRSEEVFIAGVKMDELLERKLTEVSPSHGDPTFIEYQQQNLQNHYDQKSKSEMDFPFDFNIRGALTTSLFSLSGTAEQKDTCLFHDEQIKAFCETCQVDICDACTFHLGHQLFTIQSFDNEVNNILNNIVNMAENEVAQGIQAERNLRDKIQAHQSSQRHHLIAEASSQISSLITRLIEREHEIRNEITANLSVVGKEIMSRKAEIDFQIDHVSQFGNFVKSLQNVKNRQVRRSLAKLAKERFEHLQIKTRNLTDPTKFQMKSNLIMDRQVWQAVVTQINHVCKIKRRSARQIARPATVLPQKLGGFYPSYYQSTSARKNGFRPQPIIPKKSNGNSIVGNLDIQPKLSPKIKNCYVGPRLRKPIGVGASNGLKNVNKAKASVGMNYSSDSSYERFIPLLELVTMEEIVDKGEAEASSENSKNQRKTLDTLAFLGMKEEIEVEEQIVEEIEEIECFDNEMREKCVSEDVRNKNGNSASRKEKRGKREHSRCRLEEYSPAPELSRSKSETQDTNPEEDSLDFDACEKIDLEPYDKDGAEETELFRPKPNVIHKQQKPRKSAHTGKLRDEDDAIQFEIPYWSPSLTPPYKAKPKQKPREARTKVTTVTKVSAKKKEKTDVNPNSQRKRKRKMQLLQPSGQNFQNKNKATQRIKAKKLEIAPIDRSQVDAKEDDWILSPSVYTAMHRRTANKRVIKPKTYSNCLTTMDLGNSYKLNIRQRPKKIRRQIKPKQHRKDIFKADSQKLELEELAS